MRLLLQESYIVAKDLNFLPNGYWLNSAIFLAI